MAFFGASSSNNSRKNNVEEDCGLLISIKQYGRLWLTLERTVHKSLSKFDLAVFSLPNRVSKCLLAVSSSSILVADSRFWKFKKIYMQSWNKLENLVIILLHVATFGVQFWALLLTFLLFQPQFWIEWLAFQVEPPEKFWIIFKYFQV